MKLSEFERYFKSLVQRTDFTPSGAKAKKPDITVQGGNEDSELSDENLSAAAGGIILHGDEENDNK